MKEDKKNKQIQKIPTGIPGFDIISDGGLPKFRTTLVTGTSGSAKTVFAAQFLAEGIIKSNENGVFVTFEETPEDIRENMLGFDWDIEKWEGNGKWLFVNASPEPGMKKIVTGDYDLEALLSRITYAIQKINAKRISLDSLGAIFSQFKDHSVVRDEIFRLASTLKKLKVTSILTAERIDEYGSVTRLDVEEFVTDNVVILRNVLDDEERRRTVEILKFRGTYHQKGEFPFTIIPNEGIIVIPLSAIELKQESSNIRIYSGIKELDEMCGGGFYRDSIILISGATGTGKTLMSTMFINGGLERGENCIYFAFEESRQQLFRNALGWGINFVPFEEEGKLKVVCVYPESANLEDHLINLKRVINDFKPERIAIDSLSALERVSTKKSFREFVIGITSFIKQKEIAGLFTATTPTLMGGTSITEMHISTITDLIILLRYVEMYGKMHRGLAVLKMRGSMHDKDIREIIIDNKGLHIGNPFKNVIGIIAGSPTHIEMEEIGKIDELFKRQ